MERTPKQQFILTLQPEGKCDEREGYRRLKFALKALLRSYRLRCTKIRTTEGTVTADSITREEPTP